MKALLIAVSIMVVCSGCTSIEIEHEHGELPDLKFPAIEDFCTHKARLREKHGGVVFTCEIKF